MASRKRGAPDARSGDSGAADPGAGEALAGSTEGAPVVESAEGIAALPYTDAGEHLRDEVARLRVLLELEIRRRWATGLLSRSDDGLAATFTGARDVEEMLGARPAVASEETAAFDEARRQWLVEAFGLVQARLRARVAAGEAIGSPPPFVALARRLGLRSAAIEMALLALAPHVDPTLSRLFAYLLRDGQRTSPDVELAACLLLDGDVALALAELQPDAPLRRYGLLAVQGGVGEPGGEPLPSPRLRLIPASGLVLHALGIGGLDPALARIASFVPPGDHLDRLVLADELRLRVRALLDRSPPPGPALVLVAPRGAGKRTLVAAAARAGGSPTLVVDATALPRDEPSLLQVTAALAREALLADAVLCIDGHEVLAASGGSTDGMALRALERLLDLASGPVALITSRRDAPTVELSRGVVRIDLERPDEAAAAILWEQALAGGAVFATGDATQRLASLYRLGAGSLVRAAGTAMRLAEGRAPGPTPDTRPVAPSLRVEDVHEAVRSLFADDLGRVATRVALVQSWDDLVLPDDVIARLHELVGRARQRQRVLRDWGFARKVGRGLGLAALFSGSPGTGKTMAAGLVARELGLELYQVNLAQVLSKWVGETEKNLAAAFDAAEVGHAVLLFDEADALFGKRGEVKGSNDRYANLEVDFLLQRMERFEGIALLTTNLESTLDPALRRRLALRIAFPFPDRVQRARLWRAILPRELPLDPAGLDPEALAARWDLSGGYVRNIALRAAFLAATAGEPLALRHVEEAAEREYQEHGKVTASGKLD